MLSFLEINFNGGVSLHFYVFLSDSTAACFSEDVLNEMRWKKKNLQHRLRVTVTESNQSSFPLINE